MRIKKRQCFDCKGIFPLDTYHFYSRTDRSNCLKYECRRCSQKRAKAWALNNPDKFSAYHKEYYQKNRERIMANTKQWIANNPERFKAIQKKAYEKRKAKGMSR